ncbi:hypothetical protein ACWCYL_19545 [Streptomyces sp. 900105755]|uniref:hypothetical protein n=1 Tax=Streptomyces sp. 900105755 TaxID=3154389 RepID=UPI00331E7C2C
MDITAHPEAVYDRFMTEQAPASRNAGSNFCWCLKDPKGLFNWGPPPPPSPAHGVAIAGFGPTGPVLALLLGGAGHDVIAPERAPAPGGLLPG